MMKISKLLLGIGLLAVTSAGAQTLQDGINDLNAERTKSAKATFEKLIAANPNNIDATYWLGQTYIATKDIAGARNVYSKALMASANAPLIIVGMGQVELMEKKLSEATQRFEAAITMTRGKKGDDPVILNAVGRAIVNTYTDKEKIGDINYAVEKLEAAALRDQNNADIFTNLGYAYLKAKPGEAGGKAFENYKKANAAAPNYPVAYFRLAKLFQSQKNWELFEQYLNDAIKADPRFAPAYYELSYYKMGRKDLDAASMYAQKFKENSDTDPQNAYLEASIEWAKGNAAMAKNDAAGANRSFDKAIQMAKDIIAQSGANAKGRVSKLIADAMVQKKDSANAKPFIDAYFAKSEGEEVTAFDYKLKADIYSAIPGQEDVVMSTYMEGLKVDTVLDNKLQILKDGAAFFKARGQREKEGDLMVMLIGIKPKPSLNDYFDATRAYYFGQAYEKSADMAAKLIEKYPTEIYGYDWALNNYRILDSSYTLNKAVPAAVALLEFSQKDTAKYKKNLLAAAGFLAAYYANEAKDRDKAIEYIDKMLAVDPTNPSLIKTKEQLTAPPPKPVTPPKKTTTPKTGNSSNNKANRNREALT